MGKRGAKPFEEKIGEDKFKELLKRLDIPEIAKLYCDHYIEEEDRARCKACKRTIYRAKKRMERKEKAQKRFDPIDKFEAIPEIKQFVEYLQSKRSKKISEYMNMLVRIWTWIRESNRPELVQTQRPALWDTPHIRYALKKIAELEISSYGWKQALRRLFESLERYDMLKHRLLGASAKDMRSPKGVKRKRMQFSPSEVPLILGAVNGEVRLCVKTLMTVKSRERSLLNTEWDSVNWDDEYYGFPMATITIFEPKTKGGTYWKHCPLDLWFSDLTKELREHWKRQGKPKTGKIFNVTYEKLRKAFKRQISKAVGRKVEAHDCRRSAGGWLRDLGLADLAVGHYNPLTSEAIGYTGVGWENPNIYYQRYGKRNPLTIYKRMENESEVKANTLGGVRLSALPPLSTLNFPLFSYISFEEKSWKTQIWGSH